MVPLRGIFSPNELENELYGLLMAASGNVDTDTSSMKCEYSPQLHWQHSILAVSVLPSIYASLGNGAPSRCNV